jgi:toxoflavin biosynthesis protein ToxD
LLLYIFPINQIMNIINFSQYKLKLGLLIAIALTVFVSSCQASQSANSAPLTRQECEADSSFGFIPGGKFIQGSDRTERDFAYQISAQAISKTPAGIEPAEQKLRQTGWFDGESDRQTSSLSSYCISRNLVTNQEYREFIQATNYPAPDITAAEYQQQGFLVHPYTKVQEFLWQDKVYPQNTAQHPVVLISDDDALAYADWKGQQTGATYRLPTELEWEKAARGESGNYFPWGNQWRADGTNSAGSGLNYTNKVAAFPLSKSIYGIEDMAGNVFEYTSTLEQRGSRVVMKGCGWDDYPGFCRAAYRHTRPVDSRHILFGFRLVREE